MDYKLNFLADVRRLCIKDNINNYLCKVIIYNYLFEIEYVL